MCAAFHLFDRVEDESTLQDAEGEPGFGNCGLNYLKCKRAGTRIAGKKGELFHIGRGAEGWSERPMTSIFEIIFMHEEAVEMVEA
jgi:hypothetical protein